MNFKTTFHLFIVVCTLGLSVFILHIFSNQNDHAPVENERIFSSDLIDADYLLINSKKIKVECKRTDLGWTFIRPLTALADSEKINQFISAVEGTEYMDSVTLAQRNIRELKLTDFGFTNDSPKLIIGSGTNRCSLLLGNKLPAGDLVYIKYTNKDDIMIMHSSVLDVFPKSIDDLRARTLVPGTTARTSKIMIQKGGSFIELAKNEDNNWDIHQPVQFSADNRVVDNMLDALYAAQVHSFEWDKLTPWDSKYAAVETSSSDISSRNNSYSLTPDLATLSIKVWIAGNNAGTELMLGKFTDETKKYVYAKLSDNNTIFTCDANLVDKFNVTISELRNKRLIHFPFKAINQFRFQYDGAKLTLRKDRKRGWLILEPVQWKADDEVTDSIVQMLLSFKIEEFIAVTSTNPITVNPFSTIAQICVSTLPENELCTTTNNMVAVKPDDKTLTQTIMILEGKDSNLKNTIASYADDKGTLLKLNTINKDILYKNLTEPLFFRDRNMLSLNKNSIIRIELKRNGKTETVVKGKDGRWGSVDPDVEAVKDNVIDELIFIAANMRALRIESDNVKKIEAYGLDQATMSITFGLGGDGGIQKTVQLGFRAGTDGIYARIQGEDTVFVISTELAANLTQDIY